MKRRNLLLGTAAMAALSTLPRSVLAFEGYKPGALKAALDEGKIVVLAYLTDWCPTCARQQRVLADLRNANPVYDKKIAFFRVDWDRYSNHAISTKYRIPRRSTILMLQGDKELGRIVAQTSAKDIRALLDSGLKAANA